MKKNEKIRGGALLAQALHEKGITQVFTLSGGFCNPALEGLSERGIKIINCPHEQVAGHLADGHTRITRKPAVCLVGPEGFANAIPAMMEAWGERTPVMFVTGSSTLKRQGSGGFKEIDDVAIAAPLTKYSASITDGSRIREFVDRAYKTALSGYPGPVHLSVPVDIMFSSFPADAQLDERPHLHAPRPAPRAWPDPDDLQSVLDHGSAARDDALDGFPDGGRTASIQISHYGGLCAAVSFGARQDLVVLVCALVRPRLCGDLFSGGCRCRPTLPCARTVHRTRV